MKNLFLCLLIILVQACSSNKTVEQNPPPFTTEKNFESYNQFCHSLINSWKDGKPETFSQHFDTNALYKSLEFSFSGESQNSKKLLEKYYFQFIDTHIKTIESELTQFNEWYFVSDKNNGRSGSCILHSSLEDSGILFFELHLARNEDDSISIINWYDYSSGVLAVNNLQTVLFDIINLEDKAQSSFLYQYESNRLMEFFKAVQTGKFNIAWTAYEQLDNKYKNNIIYARRILQTQPENTQQQIQAYQNYINLINPDSFVGTTFYDYYFAIENYEEAIKALEKLESHIGEISLTHFLKAISYYQLGDINKYYYYIRKSIIDDMSFKNSYETLVNHFLENEMHEDTVLLLDIYFKGFGYSFNKASFLNLPNYSKFVQSKEFDEWVVPTR